MENTIFEEKITKSRDSEFPGWLTLHPQSPTYIRLSTSRAIKYRVGVGWAVTKYCVGVGWVVTKYRVGVSWAVTKYRVGVGWAHSSQVSSNEEDVLQSGILSSLSSNLASNCPPILKNIFVCPHFFTNFIP